MYIIAGLGNPTKTYEGTRHNIGFDMIDAIADKYNVTVTTKKHKALTGKGMVDGVPVILAKPQTYMNLSGESIREIADFYKIPSENIIIIYDDISLEVGQLRIRKRAVQAGIMELKILLLIWEHRNSHGLRLVLAVNRRAGIWRIMYYPNIQKQREHV